jgi:hypothetical protein
MVQLIISAGETQSEIQFISGIDCTNLYAGDLSKYYPGAGCASDAWDAFECGCIEYVEKLGFSIFGYKYSPIQRLHNCKYDAKKQVIAMRKF